MAPEAVSTQFGKKEWNNLQFQKGDRKTRGEMAFSLLRSKKLLGKTSEMVKKEIGEFDGHFWNDTVPAYLIDPLHPKSHEQWQLVFLLDANSKVKEIRVHKNCCK